MPSANLFRIRYSYLGFASVFEGDLELMNEMKKIQASSSPQGRQHLLVAAPFVQMIFSVAP
jgi:hypothetical protein